MKIALCISGQARSYEKGFEFYKANLLSRFDVDVFIHTWTFSNAEKLKQLYAPTTILVEDSFTASEQSNLDNKYKNTPNAEKWPPKYAVSAFYSIFRSCLLKIDHETKTKQYDWVIKTRFDFALPCVLPFEKMQRDIVYMPPCRTRAWGDWLGNDQFAVGDSNTMNDYMSTYVNMEKYYEQGAQMIGEEMLRANLIYHGFRDKIAYIDMPAPFPPGPHNGTPHFLIRDDYDLWTKS